MITRRAFMASASTAAVFAQSRTIPTVAGDIKAEDLGITLMHEHLLVDFVGADQVSPARYNADEVFKVALPMLDQLKQYRCRTLVECTPAYLGRDPVLLGRLSKASGIQILTNTGYYGAMKDKFVPKLAWAETAEAIAKRWTKEADSGIDATGIRPAFMKIGVDSGPLSGIDAKLVDAGAICHRATGLRLHVHTGDGAAARGIVEVLNKHKVDPDAYVWVHAQSEKDLKVHEELGRAGVWIELDGISPKGLNQHVEAVVELAGKGLLNKLLVSQDSGWYRVGEPGGGEFNGFTYLFTDFLPALRKRGFTDSQIETLMLKNPAAVLTRTGKRAK